ncbi:DNA repair protein [Deinococcus sp.]|uniref:DNA repair protein n=1 Tax=Deinococcus sp. TaxID=47478 RepID=UPI003B5901F4
MTQATKPKKSTAKAAESPAARISDSNSETSAASRSALQTLLRTALPEVRLVDQTPTELSALLTQAHESWGFGLRHVQHELRAEAGGELALYADRSRVGSAQDTPEDLVAAYTGMQAQDEQGRSLWAVLPEGHRVTLEAGSRQIRVLVEDARDFETHWAVQSGGMFIRSGRQDETLWVEAFRPAPGAGLVQDAAWEVVERIRDRSLRRELQRRAEEKGILGALLGARGEGMEAAMRRSPSLHFTVNAAVARSQERSYDAWKALQKEAVSALDAAQQAQIERLVALLGSPARGR